MKKIFLLFLCLCLLFVPNKQVNAYAEESQIQLTAEAAVLMEPISKKVIYEKNAHKKLYPASMTKMMGLLLILEAEEQGIIDFKDIVTVSSYASSMGGTQIFLEENEKMSVEDLFKSVAINSANDAIVALGEHLASSNELFVKKMNDKAKELKMNDTHFVNATGFDDKNHYTSAYDMALLGSHLVQFGEKILKYTSMQEGYVRESSSKPFWLVNTNKLLKYYEGMDGLKTGFTQDAGYNLTATACRNGVRLISTVMHLDSIAHRSQDTIRLLDYGFSKFKAHTLYLKDDIVTTFEIDKSLNKYLSVYVNEEVKIIIDKMEKEDNIKIKTVLEKLDPPYVKGERVGYLEIKTKSMTYIFDLYAYNDVKGINLFAYLLNYLRKIFA